MSKFKPGDKVVLINVDHYSDIMKQLMGKTLVVNSIDTDGCGCEIVCARVPVEEGWFLYSDDLRLVPELVTTQKPKMLDRGDLVEYLGEVWIVTIGTTPTDIFAKISTMTGKERTRWVTAYDVTCVGNDHFNEHDKRLVTSAPDLLKQRDELLTVLKQAHRFLRKNGYDMTDIDAAIAKAKGAV